MKKILVDINVVLDVLLDRKPHAGPSAALWAAIETGMAEGVLAAHAVTTIHYLVRKERGASKARRTVTAILRVFGIAAVDGDVVRQALQFSWPDFEDSITASAAQSAGCDAIVTRDPRGFPDSPVRVLTPEAAVALFAKG
ncbi:MAG: PIN domain-containing protein [Bryobacteraceae bacterium]|jgi:predicted nucleic acid-binding protein